MYRFLRDDKNIYIMSLVYTDGAVPYSHIQLRNTVEYSDFANIETLRNKSNPHAKSRKDVIQLCVYSL